MHLSWSKTKQAELILHRTQCLGVISEKRTYLAFCIIEKLKNFNLSKLHPRVSGQFIKKLRRTTRFQIVVCPNDKRTMIWMVLNMCASSRCIRRGRCNRWFCKKKLNYWTWTPGEAVAAKSSSVPPSAVMILPRYRNLRRIRLLSEQQTNKINLPIINKNTKKNNISKLTSSCLRKLIFMIMF
jgi:hypothetical protein